MPSRFWDSEANKFTLYGAIFGFLFPIIATIIQAISHSKEISWAAIVQVQMSDPLLWIIDSAPFFLGLFARFAGRRQDQLKKIILESSAADRLQTTQLEDAKQFASVLTYLSVGLVTVVLVLGVLWLQRFIISTLAALPPNAAPSQAVVLTAAPVSDSSADRATPPLAVLVVTATSSPTSLASQLEPTNPPTTAPIATPSLVLVAAQAPPATPLSPTTIPPTIQPTIQSPPSTTLALPTKNRIGLGYIVRDVDCKFFTEVVTLVWQQEQKISVTVETFNSPDELYQALTSEADPRHVDLTLCFVDPDDRQYLIQYGGSLHVIGKAYWESEQKKLLAMADTDSPFLTNPALACANRYIQKQDYTQLQFPSVSAAAWVDANRPLIQSWLDCGAASP